MTTWHLRLSLTAIVVSLGASVGASEFIPLSTPSGDLFPRSARAVSGDGSSVTGAGVLPASTRDNALRWSASGGALRLFVDESGISTSTVGLGISDTGDAIVGYLVPDASPPFQEAFRWTGASGPISLGFLAGAPLPISGASGISADGTIVAGSSSSPNGHSEAFRWTSTEGMVGLGDLPGGSFTSFASATSASGSIIVGSGYTAQGEQAMRWTVQDGMIALGELPGGTFFSRAENVSADGNVVVGSSSSAHGELGQAFRWTEQTGMAPLGALPGGDFGSHALATSGDGSVIVGSAHDQDFTVNDNTVAFAWDQSHGMRNLKDLLVSEFGLGHELESWSLSRALDISDDGLTIVGTGINPNGETEAWLVRLDRPIDVPEPAGALFLIATVTAAVLACRGRRPGFVPAFRSGACR